MTRFWLVSNEFTSMLADPILNKPKDFVSGSIDSIPVLLIVIGIESNLTLSLTHKFSTTKLHIFCKGIVWKCVAFVPQ